MWQGKVKILTNEEVAPDCFRMALEAPQIAGQARAGQFLQVKVADSSFPLLRRPFSVHRISGKFKAPSSKLQNIEILYEVVGKGTRMLARKQAGEELDILGPLGKGFALPGGQETAILIAGGIGVAPLLALAEEVVQSSKLKAQNEKINVIIGGRTKKLIRCDEEFKKLGCQVEVATDDGSKGYKGLATDLLPQLLPTLHVTHYTVIYACGPENMLKRIAEIASERNIPAQLSLEGRLGCGVGACLGCAIKVKKAKDRGGRTAKEGDFSYKRICKDGPVFKANQIIWD